MATKKGNGNGKTVEVLGVLEKRELVKLVSTQFDEAIAKAVGVEKQLCEKAENAAFQKLGGQLIVLEMEKLEKQKSLLCERLEKLGFHLSGGSWKIHKTWNNNSEESWKLGVPASQEAYKILESSTNLNELKAKRVDTLKKIWLTTSRGEVVKLVDNGKIAVQLREVNVPSQLVTKIPVIFTKN